MAKWITLAPGIRCRDHATRRVGVRLDRYFTLRFSVNGRQVEEALGWASEGWTLNRAQEELGKLRAAQRTGEGHATLRDRVAAKRRAERQQIEAATARERQEKTISDLWDRYHKEVVAVQNKGSTVRHKLRMWERCAKPAIGNLKVKDVTEEDVGAIVRAPLRLDRAGRVVAGKGEAGSIYRFLHHLFKKALDWRLRPLELGNPLAGVEHPRVNRRERLLTEGEVGALLRALDTVQEAPQVIACIKTLVLTGARISELLTLEWGFVRRDELELHLPDTKSGFSRRPLAPEALAVLDSIERMPGVPFVFRAITDPRKPLTYNVAVKAFRRIAAAAGVRNCSPHTLRHWFATATANSVSNPRIGMALTGHKSYAAYANYLHGDKEQAHALAGRLAARITNLGTAEPSVVPLAKAAE
jgi:integrase